VGTGADAEIIGERPVVHVVPRLPARQGKRRGFVMAVTRGREPRFDRVLHLRRRIVIG
jgi:hypothetical protein